MGRAPTRSELDIPHNEGDPTHLRPCVVEFASSHDIPTNPHARLATHGAFSPMSRKLCAKVGLEGISKNHRNYACSGAASVVAISVLNQYAFIGHMVLPMYSVIGFSGIRLQM